MGPVAPGRSVNATWCPAPSVKSAWVAERIVMMPGWYGFPHPGGGLPLPSDSGASAAYQRPAMFASLMPQWV